MKQKILNKCKCHYVIKKTKKHTKYQILNLQMMYYMLIMNWMSTACSKSFNSVCFSLCEKQYNIKGFIKQFLSLHSHLFCTAQWLL